MKQDTNKEFMKMKKIHDAFSYGAGALDVACLVCLVIGGVGLMCTIIPVFQVLVLIGVSGAFGISVMYGIFLTIFKSKLVSKLKKEEARIIEEYNKLSEEEISLTADTLKAKDGVKEKLENIGHNAKALGNVIDDLKINDIFSTKNKDKRDKEKFIELSQIGDKMKEVSKKVADMIKEIDDCELVDGVYQKRLDKKDDVAIAKERRLDAPHTERHMGS